MDWESFLIFLVIDMIFSRKPLKLMKNYHQKLIKPNGLIIILFFAEAAVKLLYLKKKIKLIKQLNIPHLIVVFQSQSNHVQSIINNSTF